MQAHRLVFQVFKTIILAMLFVFAFDIISYLYRAASLNTRVENLMTSMQRVVSENNGLPVETAETYKQILLKIKADYNREDLPAGSKPDPFVLNIGWNQAKEADLDYLTDSGHVGGGGVDLSFSGKKKTWSGGTYSDVPVELLHTRMKDIGDYGDVMCCQVKIAVSQPMWGFGSMGGAKMYRTSAKDKGVAEDWNRQGYACDIFYYTYFVPCIDYKTVTE